MSDVITERPAAAVRVLLVEDSEIEASVVRRHLSRAKLGSYEVQWVTCVADAAEALATADYDIVLLDLGLPDSAGVATVESVELCSGGVPIVVLTGVDDDELGMECLHAGAQDFLGKDSVSGAVLHRRIEYARLRSSRLRSMQEALVQYKRIARDGGVGQEEEEEFDDEVAIEIEVFTPAAAHEVGVTYRDTLHAYMRHLGGQGPKPTESLEAIAGRLCDLDSGGGQVVALHLNVLQQVISHISQDEAHRYAVDGRLMVVEILRLLVDRYRDARLGG